MSQMIIFTAPFFDLNGELVLHETEDSRLTNQNRRVTKTPTLDGGVSLQDLGFSQGDRDFFITSKNVSRETYDRAAYLFQSYPRLMVTIPEGMFYGAVSNINTSGGALSLTFLVKEKLTED